MDGVEGGRVWMVAGCGGWWCGGCGGGGVGLLLFLLYLLLVAVWWVGYSDYRVYTVVVWFKHNNMPVYSNCKRIATIYRDIWSMHTRQKSGPQHYLEVRYCNILIVGTISVCLIITRREVACVRNFVG